MCEYEINLKVILSGCCEIFFSNEQIAMPIEILHRDEKDKYKFNNNHMNNKHINTIKLIMYNKITYFSYIVVELQLPFTLHSMHVTALKREYYKLAIINYS